MSTCDVFNCLFPLDVQNEIQLLSRVFCYSWLVCLLGFLVVKYVACRSEIRFRMALFSPCLMRKRVEKSEAILALLDSFQCISNSKPDYCISCLFFISNLMKPSVVYAFMQFVLQMICNTNCTHSIFRTIEAKISKITYTASRYCNFCPRSV